MYLYTGIYIQAVVAGEVVALRRSSNKMASLTLLLQGALAALTINVVCGTVNQVPLPTIDLNEWWGPGQAPATQNTSIWNYSIRFTPEMISDLRYRLQNHRPYTPPLEGIAFEYGFNSVQLVRWAKYMAEEYPFQARETFLNQFPQYKTNIQGLNIHFIRVRSQNMTILNQTESLYPFRSPYTPLLILHGWPGSVREFYETIPYLITIGEEYGIAFDIIVPSLPGFGFSDGAVRPGLGVDKAAVIFRNLMHRLGYNRYFIQGGDLGAMITCNMATLFQNEVIGYHTNFPLLYTPDIIFRLLLGNYHPEEITTSDLLPRVYPSWTKFSNILTATGYLHVQATRPDTVGVGLTDSPSALMAYTLEKVSTANRKKFITYPDGGLTAILTAEQIFDNYMIYWSSNSINTAIRMYSETFNWRYVNLRINEIKSTVPTWVVQAPDEAIYIPSWMLKAKFPNLLNETLPSEGGHFYAWEKPQLFAENVVDSIIAFRQWHAMNRTLYTKCSGYISN